MFCFTVLSSFTLFTWRKLNVHYRRKCEKGGFEVEEDGYDGGTALRGRSWGCPPAGTGTVQMAAWQPRSHPALLLAHPGGWHPGFWEGRCDWEEENARGSLYRWQQRYWWDPEDGEKVQQWQGARRRCWVQHQGKEVALLCLLSQCTWGQPHSGQLVGAVCQKRNLLWPQKISSWLSLPLFHLWRFSRAISWRKAL